MRLSTAIHLASVAMLATTLLLTGVAFWAARETDRRLAAETQLHELLDLSNELMLIAHEYRHWPAARAREQWERVHRRLTERTTGLDWPPADAAAITASMQALGDIFRELVKQTEPVAQSADVAGREVPDARFNHLLIEQRHLDARLERQLSVQKQRLNRTLGYVRTAFMLATLSLLAVGLFIALSLHRRMLPPLRRLSEQTERYAKGDLQARSGIRQHDELGDLSRGFDRLGEALERSMIARDHLRVEVARRAASEAEQAVLLAELERSNTELQQFAYVASHDLQEPLRTITSYVQLIERRYADKLDTDGREFIAFAVDGANRMRTLIDDLLTLSRVSTHGKAFERVSMARIVEQVRADLRQALEEAGAELIVGELPEITADPTQIRQLLDNLLANALRYRRAGAPVKIELRARPAEAPDSGWVFSVRDNGIGIESRFFARIFLLFQRLHGRGEYPGTGIGLAICKRIVERHGGRIWVESTPGVGSTFSFRLPPEPQSSAKTKAQQEP